MKLVTTFHPTSSVIGSLRCRLVPDSETEYLVIAKPDRVEVFSTNANGLQPECELEIMGRILALKGVPMPVRSYHNVLSRHKLTPFTG